LKLGWPYNEKLQRRLALVSAPEGKQISPCSLASSVYYFMFYVTFSSNWTRLYHFCLPVTERTFNVLNTEKTLKIWAARKNIN
jgi:hypothetical protein